MKPAQITQYIVAGCAITGYIVLRALEIEAPELLALLGAWLAPSPHTVLSR